MAGGGINVFDHPVDGGVRVFHQHALVAAQRVIAADRPPHIEQGLAVIRDDGPC